MWNLSWTRPCDIWARADVAAMADRLTAAVQPRYTFRVCSLERTDAGLRLPEANILLPGADAEKMLAQCGRAVLLACTLGAQFDNLLRAEQARDMAGAVILDACGSAWVEVGCDRAEKELAARIRGCGYCAIYETCALRKGGKRCAD